MSEEYGWDKSTQGIILSSFFIGYITCQVIFGYLANKLGGK
jgi:MFS transporter, ACS family, solute carrier family 17 (sodium-dependent inorganic phosphate cotransporter), other